MNQVELQRVMWVMGRVNQRTSPHDPWWLKIWIDNETSNKRKKNGKEKTCDCRLRQTWEHCG